MQGVSINIFIKNNSKKPKLPAKIFHAEFYGKREFKFEKLEANSLKSIKWVALEANSPNYFFVKKTFNNQESYEKGFKIDNLFIHNNAGLATEFDELTIKNSKREAEELLNDLHTKSSIEIISKYQLNSKKIEKVENALRDIAKNKPRILSIDYRPFDTRFTIYTGISNGLMGRPRDGIMKHMLHQNLALLSCRQQTSFDFQHVFISNKITERCSVSLQTGEINYIFPIYLYPEISTQQTLRRIDERIPNLNTDIAKQIAEQLGLTFTNEKETTENTFAPIDILDYIYAVLHSPTYRVKYKEFLKIDFPRVPYPKDQFTFRKLVKLGGELRSIHLMDNPIVEKYITQYPIEGNNIVGKVKAESSGMEMAPEDYMEYPKGISSERDPLYYQKLKVFINDTQYFNNVPELAWNFFIGGYQPAQKWLKDRKGRILDYDDILHYQKIIVTLCETDRLMKEIDSVDFE